MNKYFNETYISTYIDGQAYANVIKLGIEEANYKSTKTFIWKREIGGQYLGLLLSKSEDFLVINTLISKWKRGILIIYLINLGGSPNQNIIIKLDAANGNILGYYMR